MISKLYEQIKKIINQNFGFIITIIVILLVFNIKLPYTIYSPGGIINISDRIKIENAKNINGSLNLSYVSTIEANPIFMIISMINPNWDLVHNEKNSSDKNGQIMLENACDTAILLAYQKAHKSINITQSHQYVVYINEHSTTDLLVGDEIIKANHEAINSVDDYQKIINNHSINDELTLDIKRKNKYMQAKIMIKDFDGSKKSGIYLSTNYDYELDPDIMINFNKSESGSSGGLMMTLSIYSQIADLDVTHGKKIVGTGTIDINGNVGMIDGVKYKLKAAVKNKADLFIVPYDNYDEALKTKINIKAQIDIIPVKTFDEALDYLSNL